MSRVAVFARAPVRGRVKTRLAAVTDESTAFDCHVELTERTLSALTSGAFCAELWLAGRSNALVDDWCRRFDVQMREQRGADLGARMLHAFVDGVNVVVGTDIPELDADYVQRALERLQECDLVLGPTEDGGYCLIAATAPHADLFEAMPWGTSTVLDETRARAAAMGLVSSELETLWDVDDEAGWRRWRRLVG